MSTAHGQLFAAYIGSPFLSDVILVTTDNEEVYAHKIVLSAVSPTFRIMFGSPSYEEAEALKINAPYDEPTLRAILTYVYTGAVDLATVDCLRVLDAAAYYGLDALKDSAVVVLRQATTSENVFDMLNLSLQFTSRPLTDHCVTLIRQHNTEVLHSDEWERLSFSVALLLVEETVIDGELEVLRRCFAWCKKNCSDESSFSKKFAQFLRFIDFTAMTDVEVEEVEGMGAVPIEILYRAFKCHSLGLPPNHTPRKGGIVLQWEMAAASDNVLVNNNHATKLSADYFPRTVCAINKFSRGRHYWTVSVLDLRSPHDCLVGVTNKSKELAMDFHFEPCCMTLCAPPWTEVVRDPNATTSILVDHCCVVGVLLDYTENRIQWYNHVTKQLLFTAQPAVDIDTGSRPALPSPMYPMATLYHKSNGGVVLSDSTTYLNDRLHCHRFSPTYSPLSINKTPTKTRR